MDYELLLSGEMSQKSFSIFVKKIIEKRISVDYKQYSDNIGIACDYFSMFFDLDEIIGLDIIYDEYGFKATANTRVQLFGNTFKQGLELIFIIIKNLAAYTDDDILLLENGSIIVLEKKDGTLFTHINESWETEYPFDLLNIQIV